MAASAAEISAFLAQAGWGSAARAPLAGDASARRYERLARGEGRAVLMIAPPGEEMHRFARVDGWLRDHGYSAPQILALAADTGLMLLEDLGDDVLARLIERTPEREAPFYEAITDFLLDLHRHPAPDFVAPLDAKALGALIELTAQWYPPHSADALAALPGHVAAACAELDTVSKVLSLRDFHAENVIWLPSRAGVARLGLLDFQDAVAAHPAYDLVSALQDARRAVSPEVEARQMRRYARARGFDEAEFAQSCALLGAQRALRILGVFTRLCLAMGKPGYLAMMPRMWDLLQRNLAQPGLEALRVEVEAALLPPNADVLERMRQECGQHPMR